MLVCAGVHFAFESSSSRRELFNDLQVEFHPGRFQAVMGPSGSGKTTLLSLLDGTLKADKGEVTLNGLKIFEARKKKPTSIARVYQDYKLIPFLNAVENIQLAQQVAGTLKAEPQRAHELLDALGLSKVKETWVEMLSGGEKQRVALARALVNQPSVILADEPTGALDEENSAVIAGLLQKIAHNWNICVVAVTHDPEVASYADTIWEVSKKQLVPRDTPV